MSKGVSGALFDVCDPLIRPKLLLPRVKIMFTFLLLRWRGLAQSSAQLFFFIYRY